MLFIFSAGKCQKKTTINWLFNNLFLSLHVMKTCMRHIVLSLLALLMPFASATAKVRPDTMMLHKIYNYASTVDTSGIRGFQSYAYHRFEIRVPKRNITLMAVPTMYGIAYRNERMYVGEFYDRIDFDGYGKYRTRRLLEINTIPHRRRTMTTIQKYLVPEIYDITMVGGSLLSPFHQSNRKFYKMKFAFMLDGTVKVIFKPTINNTQLVEGTALVDYETGRVIETDFAGEFDMIRFNLHLEMGSDGFKCRMPVKCQLEGKFSFLGNKTTCNYHAFYDLQVAVPDSLDRSHDRMLMEQVRPEPLPADIVPLVDDYLTKQELKELKKLEDTIPRPKKKNFAKDILWDIVGDHLLNRTKGKFGSNDQGYFRIGPILNPLYLDYSQRKGITYKFDIRASYEFTPNRDITFRFKSGYRFKLHQLYFNIPIRFNYNKRRHGCLGIDINDGARIYSSEILNEVKEEARVDTLDFDKLQLDYFRDHYTKIFNSYDISDHWSFEVGFTFHSRRPVNPAAFEQFGKPKVYRSAAPRMEWQYRPLGWKGPIITLDYERSFNKFLKSNTSYERWEIDGSYIHSMKSLKSISMRLGAGLYTKKKGHQYFLDYTNFRENNIPGGWNDDWSGEFELLRSSWYNSSSYYVRSNVTYESPLLLSSWIPWAGHFIEMERLYLSVLSVTDLHPYVECGYGFTTRWLSIGAFASNKNGKFESVGFKFGFELFRKW